MYGCNLPLPQLPPAKQDAADKHQPRSCSQPTQPQGQETPAVDFAGGASHQSGADPARFLGVGAQQRAVASHVDHAWDSPRQAENLGHTRSGKYIAGSAGHPQPVAYITLGFLARQRFQMVSAGDPLRQLTQLGAVQQFAQLRLPDQNDLQELLRRSLKIGEQPDLLQHLGGEVLRLVHDHDDAPSLRMGGQKAPVQRIDHLLDAAAIGVGNDESQFLADREQKLHRSHPRIQDHGDIRVMRNTRQQRADHGGFAGADLPRQLNESARFVDAIEQMRQSLGVALAQIEITRIRGDREGLFVEAEETEVHGSQGPRGNRLARVSMLRPKRSRMPSMVASSREPGAVPPANKSPCCRVLRPPTPTPKSRIGALG